ncbi:hypothetical protein CAOG_03340 [Capsaspora owczarzaki ATCC 30864]|uniref:Ubiquitin-like domain-containing protein n=1 Tax=Capsaspora owczarzaki (strain ATCC 30864) TaxID=595528 RepID=A0A0D2UBD0_CAPO3|nr:hypothetical protein CAOG_03340 [Capsaspora owczarzaki ATCC 30864]KJE92356.1 hypothetical protein CAOG_003340 [Capsaspora owczarzaki ATCC 30864]|eukprot:XP_004364179.2 hypothetical protein CAOG_03340 [Capsaspora owczarzaki ATCC 30864]
MMDAANPAQSGSDIILLRLKVGEQDRSALATRDMTLAELCATHFRDALAQGNGVKFIHSGRLLQPDTATLEALGLQPGAVIHCQVYPLQPGQQANNASENSQPRSATGPSEAEWLASAGLGQSRQSSSPELDRFLTPLVWIIVAALWAIYYVYGRYAFDNVGFALLVMITGGALMATVS